MRNLFKHRVSSFIHLLDFTVYVFESFLMNADMEGGKQNKKCDGGKYL